MAHTLRREGRLAGMLYLVVVLTGIFSLAYVPTQIAAPDTELMLLRMVAQHALVRQGMAAFIVGQLAFLLLALALYRSLRDVNRSAVTIMLVFVVVSVPLALVTLSHRWHALALLTDPEGLALGRELREALALAAFKAYASGMEMVRLFWGLWLFPLAWLILRSRRVPRVLGVLLILGGLNYVAGVFAHLLAPTYDITLFSKYMGMAAAAGEIGTCLWLLAFGLRGDRAAELANKG